MYVCTLTNQCFISINLHFVPPPKSPSHTSTVSTLRGVATVNPTRKPSTPRRRRRRRLTGDGRALLQPTHGVLPRAPPSDGFPWHLLDPTSRLPRVVRQDQDHLHRQEARRAVLSRFRLLHPPPVRGYDGDGEEGGDIQELRGGAVQRGHRRQRLREALRRPPLPRRHRPHRRDVEYILAKYTWAKEAQKKIEKLKGEGKPLPKTFNEVQNLMGSTPLDVGRSNLAKSGQISRNALCPCDSKKRYKRFDASRPDSVLDLLNVVVLPLFDWLPLKKI